MVKRAAAQSRSNEPAPESDGFIQAYQSAENALSLLIGLARPCMK